jgi:MSHA biogenesis protein MshQ
MQNAQGSELLPLNVPLRAEYYDGRANGFVANVADVCTQVIGLSLNDLDGTDGLDASTAPSRNTAIYAPAAIAGGYSASDLSDVSLLFVHPPVGGEFNLNLQPPGQGNTGSADVEVDGPTWLEYNWSGTVDDPSAKATFGVFGRPSSLIYQREAY